MLKKLAWGLVIVNILLSLRWLQSGNILFNSDIARDFALMENIRDKQHFVLIGPRAGGIFGIYHGPLWLYLNMPLFLLGRGNPVGVGLGWGVWYMLTILGVYWAGRVIYGNKIGMLSAILYSAVGMQWVHGMNNPNGATVVFVWFFLSFYKFFKEGRFRDLVISWFLVGLMIQLQMAFAVPILLVSSVLVVFLSFKKKRLSYVWAYLILILPLSSYVLFELRHNWLQARALITFLGNREVGGMGIISRFGLRMSEMFLGGMLEVGKNSIMSLLLTFVLFLGLGNEKNKPLRFFMFLYIGFWIMISLFRGVITNLYYSPFVPVIVVVLTGYFFDSKKMVLKFLWVGLVVLNISFGIRDAIFYNQKSMNRVWGTWIAVKEASEETFKLCGPEFGYFVYTPDTFGYELSYPMNYLNRHGWGSLNTKKLTTCLLMAPNNKEHPYGRENWKSGEVRILKEPVEVKTWENGIRLEKYQLTEVEVKTPANPLMLKDVFFR